MNLKQLYYFAETCKYMNYSVAADRIFVTPQAISKSIKILEKDLGQPLFYTQKNNLYLTAFGDFFLEKATQLLDEYEQMRQDVSKEVKKYNGFLRIGITASSRNILSSAFLCGFLEEYPEIKIDIVQTSVSVLEQGVLSHNLDMAIGVLPSNNINDFDSLPLAKGGVSIIANKGDELLEKKTIVLADLKNRKLSIPSDMPKIEEEILKRSEAENLDIQITVKSPFLDLNRAYLHRSSSIAINATLGLNEFPFSDKVGHRPFAKSEGLEWGLHIFTLKNKLHHPWVTLFIDHFTNYIQQNGLHLYDSPSCLS